MATGACMASLRKGFFHNREDATAKFLMDTKGLSEDEAITLMSVAADFGVTQVVDGNWGVHGIIEKGIFP